MGSSGLEEVLEEKNDDITEQSMTSQVVRQILDDHGVDTSRFGEGDAKTFEDFVEEVRSGTSRLMLDATEHKKIVRVVDVVLLRLCHKQATDEDDDSEPVERFLVECKTSRLPGIKRDPHETLWTAAQTTLKEIIDVGVNEVQLNFGYTEVFEEEADSLSYPGMRTVYRKEILEGVLTTEDPEVLRRIGLEGCEEFTAVTPSTGSGRVSSTSFTWLTETECEERGVQLQAPTDGEYLSKLVQAPVGYEEEALKDYLEAHHVDISAFGKNHAKTLGDLTSELIRGESVLMRQADGSIIRVVDVVLLQIRRPEFGLVLMQVAEEFTDGKRENNRMLPGGKRRPDEHPFLAAQRIARSQLNVDPNYLKFDMDACAVSEDSGDSLSYPGLRTLYRKRVLEGELDDAAVAEVDRPRSVSFR